MRNSACRLENLVFQTPLGWVGVAVSERGIYKIVLPKKTKNAVQFDLWMVQQGDHFESNNIKRLPHKLLDKASVLLRKYFSGECVSFDLPLDLRYYTPFQQAVWLTVSTIPYGETRTYAWIARKIKHPYAFRAVGQANGANPIPIIIP